MPETQDFATTDANAQSARLTPAQLQEWIAYSQRRLDAGLPLDRRGIPAGYKVDGGKIVPQNWWDQWGKDATIGMSTALAAGYGLDALNGVLGGGASAAGGSGDVAGGVAIPGGEFDPSMVYGGASGPTAGIPPEFGSTATDTLTSGASGGASKLPDWLKVAQELNGPLTAYSTGQAAGRNADNLANIGYANAQNNLYNNQLTAPQKIASNAVRGDILSNARDVSIAAPSDIPVPTISGGLRPSMFSDQTRQLGRNITNAAANTPIPTPSPPVLQPFESAGNGTNILNDANTVTSLIKPGYDIWKMFNHG